MSFSSLGLEVGGKRLSQTQSIDHWVKGERSRPLRVCLCVYVYTKCDGIMGQDVLLNLGTKDKVGLCFSECVRIID